MLIIWHIASRVAGTFHLMETEGMGPGVRRDDSWRALLLRQRDRKLAVADAHRQAFHEFRHCVLAIGADQFGERREQARLREAVAIDAVVPRLRPGLIEVAERGLLLF